MKQTIMDKQQKWLLRRFHTICSRIGMTEEEKFEVIHSFGVKSSADLDNADLTKICFELEKLLDPALAELDLWRKRVMAAIGGYLEFIGKEQRPELIKAIACRATGFTEFNKIPVERLKNIYNAFTQKTRDFKRSWKQMEEQLCLKK